METTDLKVFSIIVKIWIHDSGETTWHGRVTHIPGGEEWYVCRVEDIGLVVSRYLEEYGLKPGMCVRVWRWMRWLTGR